MLQEIIKILQNLKITDIYDNSLHTNQTSAFFCNNRAKEKNFHTHAIQNGCKTIIEISNSFKLEIKNDIQYIYLPSDESYISLLQEFYKTDTIKKIAVTGTNGKTSTVHFGASLCSFLGVKSATIGTNGICIYENGEAINSTHTGLTTPTITENYRIIYNLARKNVKYLFMEASSIGIHQGRINGINFEIACFTNFTQDHLDYHHTMESYFAQKNRLFSEFLKTTGTAILNEKDPYSKKIITNAKKIFYGNEKYQKTQNNFLLNIENNNIAFNVAGEFQVLNFYCAFYTLCELGFSPKKIIKFIPLLKAPSGRMEKHIINGVNVIIDYAHTPDALEKVLQNIDGFKITVFGCGGDRDPSKRPQMGKIASELSDFVIITNDNPRHENPETIAKEISQGCTNAKYKIILDRTTAITTAIKECKKNGTVIIAGKGNENYQIIGNTKLPFSDTQTIQNLQQNSGQKFIGYRSKNIKPL